MTRLATVRACVVRSARLIALRMSASLPTAESNALYLALTEAAPDHNRPTP